MNMIANGRYTDTRKRVCTESWLGEKNPLGIESAPPACRTDALPTELYIPTHVLTSFLIQDLEEPLAFNNSIGESFRCSGATSVQLV